LRYEPNDTWYVEPYVQFASRQSRLSPRDVRDVRIDPEGTPGWGTVNVRAQWMPRNNLRLGAAVENLADKRYRVHGSGIDAVGRNLWVSAQLLW
jgi:outer membrane receptor protein involved in Fe transport